MNVSKLPRGLLKLHGLLMPIRPVMREAKPDHHQRLAVVLMVRLDVLIGATHCAWSSLKTPITQRVTHRCPGSVFLRVPQAAADL